MAPLKKGRRCAGIIGNLICHQPHKTETNNDRASKPSVLALPHPDYEINYELARETENFVNITETQGLFYRLGGTMGLHVDWENRPVKGKSQISDRR